MSDWLQLESLDFHYQTVPVIAALNLSIPDDQPCLAIVGPSGVGKSAMVGLLAGHLQPCGGFITVCGEKVTGPSRHRPVVFQDHNLFPWMSEVDNVAFGSRVSGAGFRRLRLRRVGYEVAGVERTREGPARLGGRTDQTVGRADLIGAPGRAWITSA
jgi:NitT/TauT family transport system ATP-binding protein